MMSTHHRCLARYFLKLPLQYYQKYLPDIQVHFVYKITQAFFTNFAVIYRKLHFIPHFYVERKKTYLNSEENIFLMSRYTSESWTENSLL